MRTWLMILLVAIIAEGATAQEAPFAGVAEAVKALGSDCFAVREKASRFLFAAGRGAEPALEKACQSEDVEVATRAREILKSFHWGIYPDTPKSIVAHIEKFKASARDEEKRTAFKSILGERPHGARTAALLVARVAKSEEGMPKDAVRPSQNLAHQLRDSILAEVPDRLWAKELDALEELLEFCLLTKTDEARRDYAAFLHLRGRVEAQIPRWRARAEAPGGEAAAALLTYLYRIEGDAKNLRWAAEKSTDPNLIELVLHEHSAWTELIARHSKMTSTRGTLAFRSAYHRLAGQTREFEDSVAAVVKAARERPKDEWHARPLFQGARPNEALVVLKVMDEWQFAYSILCAQTRYREAFQLVEQAPVKKKDGLQLMRALKLHELGEREQACKILKDYAPVWKARFSEDKVETNSNHYAFLAYTEHSLGLFDDSLARAEQLVRRFPETDGDIVARIFWDDRQNTALWWSLLRRHHGQEPLAKTLGRMHDWIEKRPPAELEAVVKAAIPWLKSTKRQHELRRLAEICQGFERDDLERHCLEKLAEWDNRPLELCLFLLRKKQWAEAEVHLAKIKNNATAYYLRGRALVKLGREEEGRRWLELAHWLPLGNNRNRHFGLFYTHGCDELYDPSSRDWDLTLRLGNDEDFYMCAALKKAARAAARQGRFEEAVAMAERADLSMLYTNTGYWEDSSYLREPHRILVMRARGEIKAGKHDAARRTIASATELMPGNIDLPLACVPALERNGQKADADALFDRFFEHYRKLCKDYPRSGEFHNKCAWLAARCQRQLDDALGHAKEAVSLAAKDTTYLATLAEVHFQRGEQKLAVDAITRATALEPHSEHLRKQRQRITAGDRAVPVPEN